MTKLPMWIESIRTKYYGENNIEAIKDLNKTFQAVAIAWEALQYGFNGQTIKQPGMSVQSRPLTNSEIRLSLEAAMSRIQKLGEE